MKTFTFLIFSLAVSGLSAQLPNNTPVPKVTGYDFDGNKFPFAEKLKDHYSVVVFGCLT